MALQTDSERTVTLARDSCNTCFGKQRRAEIIGQRAHQSFVALAKGQQCWTLARAFLGLGEASHAANDAAFRLFGFVDLREGAAKAQPFRVSRVNAGNGGTHKAIEQLSGEFSADEGVDGVVAI